MVYVVGWITIALITAWVTCSTLTILWKACRDMVCYFVVGLKPDYSKWRWSYIAPCLFYHSLKAQTRAWWYGYESRVFPQ